MLGMISVTVTDHSMVSVELLYLFAKKNYAYARLFSLKKKKKS